eukprot:ANDGO_02514.mRNA.1 hypothetical protein
MNKLVFITYLITIATTCVLYGTLASESWAVFSYEYTYGTHKDYIKVSPVLQGVILQIASSVPADASTDAYMTPTLFSFPVIQAESKVDVSSSGGRTFIDKIVAAAAATSGFASSVVVVSALVCLCGLVGSYHVDAYKASSFALMGGALSIVVGLFSLGIVITWYSLKPSVDDFKTFLENFRPISTTYSSNGSVSLAYGFALYGFIIVILFSFACGLLFLQGAKRLRLVGQKPKSGPYSQFNDQMSEHLA